MCRNGHESSEGECKECKRLRDAKYRYNNAEKIKKSQRKTYRKYHESRKQKMRDYAAANSKAAVDRAARWNADHPESKRAAVRNRRRRLQGAAGTHDAKDVEVLYKKQSGRCAGCQCTLAAGYHVDHKNPVARGGSNWPRNLQLLCARCNHRKGAMNMREWTRKRLAYGK